MIRTRRTARRSSENKPGAVVEDLVLRGRRIMIANRLVLGTLICATASLGIWLPLCLLDNALHLPPGLRLALSIGALVFTGWLFWRYLFEQVLKPQSLEEVALTLEHLFEIPENLLINALCFEGRRFRAVEKPFARKTVQAALTGLPATEIGKLWQTRQIARWAAPVAVVLLLWFIYAASSSRHVANALRRYILPLSDTPPAGSVTLKIAPNEDILLSEGDDLTVTARIVGRPGMLRSYPRIVWREDVTQIDSEEQGGQTATMRATGGQSGEFHYQFERVSRPFAFRVFAADTYSENVRVTVSRVPRITESHFHVTAPAYTGLGGIDSLGPPEPLSGFLESNVLVTVRLDKKADRLSWKAGDEIVTFDRLGEHWQAKTCLREPGDYAIDVGRPGVAKDVTIASGAILLQQDGPPQVEFDLATNRLLVDPGERLHLGVRASDDYGLRDLQVTVRPNQSDEEPAVVETWTYSGPPGQKGPLAETLLLSIDSERFQPGGSYLLEACGRDFSPQSDIGRSPSLLLQVRSLEELTVSEEDPAAAAFAALSQAIQAQQTALGTTRNLLANLADVLSPARTESEKTASLDRHRDELDRKQGRVGEHMTEVWDVSQEPRPDFVHRVVELRDREQKQTMEKIAVVGLDAGSSQGADAPSSIDGPESAGSPKSCLESVERLQAYILEQLIGVKGGYVRFNEAEAEEAAQEVLGLVDEPDLSLEEAVETFTSELEAFGQEQKKVMHDRQMIADLPPEDFTEEEEHRLEQLALDQSRLSEILSDAVNDFTNLDLQDFGDNAMVEEMKSVFEQAEELAEIADEAAEMRQARVDAYRLETEAVEMAEEILINCEATMGFHDNIQFIAEVPEDEQLVAPLAELPWELEDLVGDLITSEEEMRPEVEDIGSYLNSLDHTAGPIADGTISSMSAKGKTGDQRPEENIIQGRSGAGRSGMSDGQLVESVAKDLSDNEYALRERTSNTPLESGQVQDEDTGAQMGGTGLGKTTDGMAMFGVGGRLPPKVLDMMSQTLDRQLNIRRSTQEIIAKLEHHNLPTQELDRSIAAMQAVEEALQAGDGLAVESAYATVVDSLSRSHRAIGRQIAFQHTPDAELARRLRQVQSGQDLQRFRGYESIIRAYFEALAEGDQRSQVDRKRGPEQ